MNLTWVARAAFLNSLSWSSPDAQAVPTVVDADFSFPVSQLSGVLEYPMAFG
jgi:hypothetical protein